MKSQKTPFATGWWAFDLGDYRPCGSTYCLFPYEGLPDLPPVEWHGDFHWLTPLESSLDNLMGIYRPSKEAQREMARILAEIQEEARSLGLPLPPAFVTLMDSWELQARIPSCTGCYFEPAEHFVPCIGQEDSYLLRFLNDQQGVLLWYLYLNREGEHAVVVSPVNFDEFDVNQLDEEERQNVIAATRYCGAPFEEFIYRFWFENGLWFAVNEADAPLTAEQRRYLSHYLASG